MNIPRYLSAAIVIATAGLLLVLSRIDCGGTYNTLTGPGLTLDETYNVEQGVYNPDHPPLGRLLLGLAHEAVIRVAPGNASGRVSIAAGRVGTALMFAATVLLVTWFAGRNVGLGAGIVSGCALIMMPRVVGHAHLGSLETFIGFFYTATILAASRLAHRPAPTGTVAAMTVGGLLGLSLLTKIQAIFLPAAIVPWLLLSRRGRGVRPAIALSLTAAAVFVVLWPWLWLDPVSHLAEYLGRTTDRSTVYNFYLGTRYGAPPPDASVPAVPWHYTAVMFLVSVPIGLHALGFTGLWIARRQLRAWPGVVTAGVAVPLAAFSIPGTPVYDGTRLFLVVFPLWAILIGLGWNSVWQRVAAAGSVWPRRVLCVGLVLQSCGTITSGPFYLSYYNLLTGGTRGAGALGFETSYWGEGATTDIWEAVPKGETVSVAPVLDQYRLESLQKYLPVVQRRNIRLRPFEYDLQAQPGLLLVLHRRADLPGDLAEFVARTPPLAQTRLQGVPLASLIENNAP